MGETIRTEKPIEMFKEWVTEAAQQQHIDPGSDSCCYVVHLLDQFVRPEGLYGDVGNRPEHPLGPLLFAAARAHGAERFMLLRAVGDLSLFLTGVFYGSLNRRRVSADYYSQLGGAAYGQAAAACRSKSNAELFEELAGSFVTLTMVLHFVSRRCALDVRPDLLALHDRFENDADEHSAAMLRGYGVALPHDPSAPHWSRNH